MAALEGMRVLDLTQHEAGPSCTQLLAWLGADVVKIEPPGPGEPGRRRPRDTEDSLFFLSHNSNKRSVAIDLKSGPGRDLLLSLVPRFDALVENFGPGTMDDLNLGYATLKAANRRLIYATVKGFGLSGLYSSFKSYDGVALAVGGAFSLTGEVDGRPVRPGPSFGDTGSGLILASGILAAYVQVLRTGEGQVVEVSMQEAVLHTIRTALTHAEANRDSAVPRAGNGNGAPTDLYPCAPGGSNDYVYIRVASEQEWQTFVAVIGQPELTADARFATLTTRLQNRAALRELVCQWTGARTKYEAMEALAGQGVPCGAVLDSQDIFRDPHLQSRQAIVTLDHPTKGAWKTPAPPVRLSASAVQMTAAPLLARDTRDVLRTELGLDDSTLRQLAESGVIGLRPV